MALMELKSANLLFHQLIDLAHGALASSSHYAPLNAFLNDHVNLVVKAQSVSNGSGSDGLLKA